MEWMNPLPLNLIPTSNPESFKDMPVGATGLPFGDHPGAFGFQRKHHVHEGVDLYCPEFTEVMAVEAGVVVAIIDFTGPDAVPPSSWWKPTKAILVEGDSGVVVYGEVIPRSTIFVGSKVWPNEIIAHVKRVLVKDKGRPMSMLHLELHQHGTRDAYEWLEERPPTLLDPTEHLKTARFTKLTGFAQCMASLDTIGVMLRDVSDDTRENYREARRQSRLNETQGYIINAAVWSIFLILFVLLVTGQFPPWGYR